MKDAGMLSQLVNIEMQLSLTAFGDYMSLSHVAQ
jgi:hypothetical protein